MSKVQCKGTVLKQTIGTVPTAVAQIISLDLPDFESETYEADTLDNASADIPYESTGRTETGTLSGELFLDPALGSHEALLALLETPADEAWLLTFSDATDWTFNSAGFALGGTVALNDGLKGSFSIKLKDLPSEFSGY